MATIEFLTVPESSDPFSGPVPALRITSQGFALPSRSETWALTWEELEKVLEQGARLLHRRQKGERARYLAESMRDLADRLEDDPYSESSAAISRAVGSVLAPLVESSSTSASTTSESEAS